MSCNIREPIEWITTWHSKANDETVSRWLFIGDSVTRHICGSMQELLKDKNIAIDYWCSSAWIGNSETFLELESFMRDKYKYEKVFLNIGCHHGYVYGDDFAKEKKEFDINFRKTIDFFCTFANEIIIITGTPQTQDDSLHNTYDNEHVKVRNDIMRKCALNKNLKCIDLFDLFKRNGIGTNVFRDKFHFEKFLSDYLAWSVYSNCFNISPFPFTNICFVETLDELKSIIQNQDVYIYGNGARGKSLYAFISKTSPSTPLHYVISDSEYKKDDVDNTILPISAYAIIRGGV